MPPHALFASTAAGPRAARDRHLHHEVPLFEKQSGPQPPLPFATRARADGFERLHLRLSTTHGTDRERRWDQTRCIHEDWGRGFGEQWRVDGQPVTAGDRPIPPYRGI